MSRRATIVVVLAVLTGCGGTIGPDSLEGQADGSLALLFDRCAQDGSARVTERSDEIRIDRISGRALDGDCQGGVAVQLDAPVRDRRVLVDDTP